MVNLCASPPTTCLKKFFSTTDAHLAENENVRNLQAVHVVFLFILSRNATMGKGDKRSRRGKIFNGSSGKSRPTTKNKRNRRKAAATA
jgi:ribosomal small subunit protein bTHX